MTATRLRWTTGDQWRIRVGLAMALIALVGLLIPTARAEAQVGIESADGCSGAVCISVEGSGLTVTSWRTTASVSSYRCESAYFKRNGYAIRIMQDCASSTLSKTWDNPGSFSDGDQLCNTWSDVSGQPCITIDG